MMPIRGWGISATDHPRLHVRHVQSGGVLRQLIEACDHRQQNIQVAVAALARSIARTWIEDLRLIEA